MTADPIADMLTRVRNALIARHPKVDVPASRLKNEMARILKEEGYILNYKLTEEGVEEVHPPVPEVHAVESAGDFAHRARFASGLPRVCRQQGDSAHSGRSGHQHSHYAERCDDRVRPRAKKASAAKFSVRSGKERTHVTSRKKADSPAERASKSRSANELQVEGPKGKLTVPIPAGVTYRAEGWTRWNWFAIATSSPRCTD